MGAVGVGSDGSLGTVVGGTSVGVVSTGFGAGVAFTGAGAVAVGFRGRVGTAVAVSTAFLEISTVGSKYAT